MGCRTRLVEVTTWREIVAAVGGSGVRRIRHGNRWPDIGVAMILAGLGVSRAGRSSGSACRAGSIRTELEADATIDGTAVKRPPGIDRPCAVRRTTGEQQRTVAGLAKVQQVLGIDEQTDVAKH